MKTCSAALAVLLLITPCFAEKGLIFLRDGSWNEGHSDQCSYCSY